jgi:hypothetical protein
MEGWVYLISCDDYPPDWNKVGMTTQTDPMWRRNEMANAEGLIETIPLRIEFAKKVANCAETEKLIHNIFKANRVPGKEWFKGISRESFFIVFDLIPGEWYQGITLTPKKPKTMRVTLGMCLVDGDKVRCRDNPDYIVKYDAVKACLVEPDSGKTYVTLASLETKPSKRAWETCEVLGDNNMWIRMSDYRRLKLNVDEDDDDSAETPSVTAQAATEVS